VVKADVAIVGNGVAGFACAARLARHGWRPLLVGPGLPVDRPPLTKTALASGVPTLLADESRLAERGIGRLDGTVTDADLLAGSLDVDTAAGVIQVDAELIVIATGLTYEPPPVPGLEAAFVNADPLQFDVLAARLAAGSRRVLVVGAGLIGVESAATLAAAGHEVTIVDLLPRPLDRLHDPVPALARRALDELGVRFVGEVHVERLEPVGPSSASAPDPRGSGDVRMTTAEHGTFTAELVLAATGGRPAAPPGLSSAELPLAVDATMRVPGYERVYAAGDLVLVPHARFGAIRFPHWDAAIGTGEQTADSIAGVAGPYERLPYWWSDIGTLRLAEVGVAEQVAEWHDLGGMHVGRDVSGEVVCALVVDEPRRLREARGLVGDVARGGA
jgi:3-phenylpropionate/trans-cinnamate dioxygenase ferredoxin reductase subunit